MLEQPRAQDVGGDLREDASFFLVLFAVGIVVLFASAFATAYTRVACITYKQCIIIDYYMSYLNTILTNIKCIYN